MTDPSGFDPVHPLHDRFVKDFLHDPADAADVLQCALNPLFSDPLSWSELRQEPCEFITELLGQKNSDLLFSLPYGEGRLRLFLLVEHLSHPDRNMPLRAAEYKHCSFRHQLKSGEAPSPVICVVLYHGKEAWKAPANLGEWLKLSPGQAAEVGSFTAAREYVLLDISAVNVEALALRAYGKMVLSFLRSVIFGWEKDWLRRHAALIDECLGDPDRQSRIRTLIRYCLQASDLDFSAFQRELNALPFPKVKDAFMSTADMLLEKGRVEGLEQGLGRGLEKGELLGKIAAYERMLNLTQTSRQNLDRLSVPELHSKIEKLEAKLFK